MSPIPGPRSVLTQGTDHTPSLRQAIPVKPQLSVRCWCQGQTVVVAQSEVKAGRTGSCGKRACHG